MIDAFKTINEEVTAPESIKRDVMWHLDNVYLVSHVSKHFTIDMAKSFANLFLNKKNNKDKN